MLSLIAVRRFHASSTRLMPRITKYKVDGDSMPVKVQQQKPPVPAKKDLKYNHKEHSYVTFNPRTLRSLSGGDKIAIFRDLLATKSPFDAVTVWKVIVANGLQNQLVYKDYHCFLHLLMTNARRHKDALIDLNLQLRINNLVPSENFLNCYLVCATKWNDETTAMNFFAELQKGKLVIDRETWEALLSLFSVSKDKSKWAWGLELWELFKSQQPMQRPSRLIYLRVFDLLIKSKNLQGTLSLYNEACDDVIRLHRSHQSKAKGKDKQFGLDTRIRFFNAYLSALMEAGNFEEAKQFAHSFQQEGYLSKASKLASITDSFQLLIKLAFKLNDSAMGVRLHQEMRDRAIELDHVMFGRLISLAGFSKDEERAISLFDSAMVRLQIQPGTMKHRAIHETLAMALASFAPTKAFGTLMNIISESGENPPLRATYYHMMDHLSGKDLSIVWNCFVKDYKETTSWVNVPEKYKVDPYVSDV